MVSDVGMDLTPIVLPSVPVPAARPPLPFLAAVVPVAGGIVLWLVTGSLYSLCFAALGPLMLAASLLDGMRTRRRDLRRHRAEAAVAWAGAEDELRDRHRIERASLWQHHPDVASCLAQPPLRGIERPDSTTEIVVGSGSVTIGIRTSGGADDRAREFQRRCGILESAPIRVPLGQGVCVRGCAPQRSAVVRGLVAQLCFRYGPTQLVITGDRLDQHGLAMLPHARAARRGEFRVAIAEAGEARVPADAVIWLAAPDAEVPEGITTVIDATEMRSARVRTPSGSLDLAVEGVSVDQIAQIARDIGDRSETSDDVPGVVHFDELTQRAGERGLPAVIGRTASGEVIVDVVDDGPHAIVTGTTGTGKSELLVTWVTAIASAHGPDRVSFVLADFKGGTAFEPLRSLPQVAAVITDLDEEGARRGVSSLKAEMRRREATLAAAGVRDVCEVAMPRLVIVIDEFAALIHEHPDLSGVFTDIAARGRALGMHLILGTQRASGVVRDALAANCPLRMSLRVSDPAESRLMLGTTEAAEIPGGTEARGLGFVRRPQDGEPLAVRVALTTEEDLSRASAEWEDAARSASPWLPALPVLLRLEDVRAPGGVDDRLVLGKADDPEHQAQPPEMLRVGVDRGLAILGASGSGRSSALRTLAFQFSEAIWMPNDPEEAWDMVASWAEGSVRLPALLLCDDVDQTAAALPAEYAQEWLRRLEQLLRGGHGSTFVLVAGRVTGGVARLVEALPIRALLRMPSRVEHLAAGGEPSGFLRDRPAGRARIGEREVQFAWVDGAEPATAPRASLWVPGAEHVGVVAPATSSTLRRLQSAYPRSVVIPLESGLAPGPGNAAEFSVDPASASVIMVADADIWQRNLPLWRRIRAEGEVLIRAENAAELRHLAGVRDLPPYARLHAGRAWSVRADHPPRRVIVSAFAPSGALIDAPRTRRQRRLDAEVGQGRTMNGADHP